MALRISILTREYPPFIYGGAGVHVGQLVPQLRKYTQSVEVQCMGQPRPDAIAHPEDFPAGANPALRILGTDVAMADAIGDVDVIHSHTWYTNFAGLVGSKLLNVPHVVTSHSLEPHRPWKAEQLGGGYRVSCWAERTAFADAAAVISVSEGMRRDVLASYPELDPDRVFVVRNGIDTDEFTPDTHTDTLDELGIDLGQPLVVFVGRITRQKGLVHLLRAAQQFDPDTQLLLLAGSPDTPEIAAEFDAAFTTLSQQRPGKVTWVAEMLPRAAVRQAMSHAAVFACPSVYEPLGIVNLEAMACQTAVVASAVGGIPEVVADGVTGSLVAYDPQQAKDPAYVADFEQRFAQQVNRITRDPALAARYGQAGRKRAIEQFSWERIARQTVAVYDAAIRLHHS